jgi:hypothetical protein
LTDAGILAKVLPVKKLMKVTREGRGRLLDLLMVLPLESSAFTTHVNAAGVGNRHLACCVKED